jgi:hypothetical protein
VLRDTRRSSKPEYRARLNSQFRHKSDAQKTDDRFAICGPWCSTNSRDTNTGASQDFTDLTAAVQLRLRVACLCRQPLWVASIAAMQRSLKPQSTERHRGGPPFCRRGSVATGVCTRRQFCELPGVRPARVQVAACKRSLRRLHFAPVAQITRVRRFERRGCR